MENLSLKCFITVMHIWKQGIQSIVLHDIPEQNGSI